MNTLIVYFSKFGNTRKVAESVGEVMRQAGDARVVSIDQFAASDLESAGLVVVGSPTHAFNVPRAVRAALDALPQAILAGKSVAAFDTTVRLWPLRHMRASPKLLRRLRQLGGRPVAPPQTFYVKTSGTQQPGEVDLLLEGEMERARQWADGLLNRSRTPAGT
ncbi:MAG: flavodoxin domain-containing protein [Sedimentisphaerales bacterium]|nr:flavodoxin domain-containing protein [Sedimentisphaerales bacterium]